VLRRIVLMKLQAVGLRGTHALAPNELSGGMRGAWPSARAISADPMLTMYDEPSAGSIRSRSRHRQPHPAIERCAARPPIVVSYDVSEALKLVD